MHCASCRTKFTVFKRKKQCSECRGYYCNHCLQRKANKQINCENCLILTSRPLSKVQLLKLRARDLQLYLSNQKVSTRGCVEKEDLVELLLAHANGTPDQSQTQPREQPRPSRFETNATSHILNNIRSFFNSTPDISGSSNQQTSSTHSTPCSTSRTQHSPSNDQTNRQDSQPESQPGRQSAPTTESPESQESPPDDWEVINSPESTSADEYTINDSDNDEREPESYKHESGDTERVRNFLQLSDIKTIEELKDLSVKQLKELLTLNRVDYKGCVEKTELLERVNRLWTQHSRSRENLEHISSEDICKICMDAPVECVMLECGHMATCTSCGKQLSECPICRQYVVRVVRIFKA